MVNAMPYIIELWMHMEVAQHERSIGHESTEALAEGELTA